MTSGRLGTIRPPIAPCRGKMTGRGARDECWRARQDVYPSTAVPWTATVMNDQISRRFALVVVAIVLAACSGAVAAKDIPPAGQMWFGQSFDPSTFALTGKTSTVGTTQPVALVAHLTKAAASTMTIRASLNGTFVNSAPVTVTGSGDVFGYVLGALVSPGQWTYDVVDVGGNVLASGTVTAT